MRVIRCTERISRHTVMYLASRVGSVGINMAHGSSHHITRYPHILTVVLIEDRSHRMHIQIYTIMYYASNNAPVVI